MGICDQFEQSIDSIRHDSIRIRMEKNTQKQRKMWLDAEEKLQLAIEVHAKIYE